MKIIASIAKDDEYYVGYDGEEMPPNARIIEMLELADATLRKLNYVIEIKRPLLARYTFCAQDFDSATDLMAEYDHTFLVTVAAKVASEVS